MFLSRKEVVENLDIILGNVVYIKSVHRAQDIEHVRRFCPKYFRVELVKIILNGWGSGDIPTNSKNIDTCYMPVDESLYLLLVKWKEILSPQIVDWIERGLSVEDVAEKFEYIMASLDVSKDDRVGIFSYILSSGICVKFQVRNAIVGSVNAVERLPDGLMFA